MTQDPADLLKELLDVTPSPAFAAGVRARVDEAVPQVIPRGWFLTAGTLAAAGLIAAWIWTARTPVVAPAGAPAVVSAGRTPALVADTAKPAPPKPDRPPTARKANDRPVVTASTGAVVPRDQARALDALLNGLSNGTFVMPATADPLIELPRIEIPPIRIELLPDPVDVEGE